MATVYLAEDLKHHRRVAIKVLRPELAATLGAERFSREIEVAARLQHPHILGVFDSGDADGFFYYVMPYVEGETLRDRLTRSGELPAAEAVRLLSEVAEALSIAHRAGVVHRDIKPENVLLSGRHAMVMDFGVAKAVTEATGAHNLTSVGVALGTPSYMAPEQATADPGMDARVDIYAVGVMGYEMLTGHTPFPGLNPQQTLAAHVTQAPIPVGQQRAGLSPALDAAIMRCLAKRPADRFQTADELVRALEPLTASSGGTTPTHTQPVPSLRAAPAKKPVPMYAIGGVAVLALAAALFAWKPWNRTGAKPLDANLVAVMPFRVAGADPSVQYLRQGMLDLLQAKLTGEGGARAADTRSVLAAVRDAGGTDTQDLDGNAVVTLAKKIGAGRVLQGSIVGPADHLVISGTLLEMPGGKTIAQTSVEGPKDSLFVLIDRLTGQLLALGAGASQNQLSALTTTNLDALRAYLDGVTAYRRAAFDVATPLLEKAVGLDSTFALALSALIEADGWQASTGDMNRVSQLAWQYRDRLNPQDQLFLSLRLGSAYPVQTPWTVRIADREKAVQKMPESADAWYYLGDALFHFGLLSDVPDPQVRARRAFEQAFQRDSLYGAPIQHLAALTFVAGDTAAQRLWTNRLVALDASSEVYNSRWQLFSGTHDAKGISAWLAVVDTMPVVYPGLLIAVNSLDSATLAHQDDLFEMVRRKATTKAQRNEMAQGRWVVLLNRGRAAEAGQWLDTLENGEPGSAGIFRMLGGIYGGGPGLDTTKVRPMLADHWRLSQGDTVAGKRVVAVFRQRAAADTLHLGWYATAPIADAMLAVSRGDPKAGQLVDHADSLWVGRDGSADWASIQLARLYEAQGRTDRALRAIRRRSLLEGGQPAIEMLAESYRLEGQLAAKLGDRAAAIAAYKNYLKLRFDPDSSRIPQRDSVRAEYAAIADAEKQKQ